MNGQVPKFFISLVAIFCTTLLANAQANNRVLIRFDENKTYQTIENFGASDAWACQFVGNWPDEKKNTIADWLFSMDTLTDGNPKGIGLSLWRYNLGAGSAEQKDSSGIRDEWRRAALTTNQNNTAYKKVLAQNWFLNAAKQRGVKDFLAFFNSPPVHLTMNGKAFANKNSGNLSSTNYKAFADYTVNAMEQIKKTTGVAFNYVSPVNEPQWDWNDGGQEGCPYTNTEISGIVKAFNSAFQQNKVNTKILIAESGNLKYLLPADDKKDKDDQVRDFFNASSATYVGDLPNISHTIASHSYFTTSPLTKALALRTRVKDSIDKIKGLTFWQSEYCILGDNAGEINGSKKDLGMTPALYIAKVIYEDLVAANASAWQWWIAVSAYNYKDGLIYVDKKATDGNFSDSKMLWAMGNYSRFIRPGMKRIDVDGMPGNLLVSGYKDVQDNKLVFVVVNENASEKFIALGNNLYPGSQVTTFTTDAASNLGKKILSSNELIIPARSVVTIIVNNSLSKP